MEYQIFFHPAAYSSLEKLESKISSQIRKKVQELRNDPKIEINLKHTDFWRLMVQDYRVIYEILYEERKVIVLFIGHRKNVYDRFSRLF